MADELNKILDTLAKGVNDAMAKGDVEKAKAYAAEITRLEKTKGPPEKTLGEAAAGAFYNAPESFMKNMVYQPLDFIKTAVTDPGKAIGAMISPLAGAALKVPGGRALDTFFGGTPERQQQNEATADAIGEMYGNRYGSWKGFKEDLSTDPFGIVGDAATVAAPASKLLGLPLRAAGVEAKIPLLLGNIGKAVTNPVGEVVGAATRHIGNIPTYFSGPKSRARARIADIMEEYPDPQGDLARLGPEGIVADTLGETGRVEARAAGNMNPLAADELKKVGSARAEGSKERVRTALEDVEAAHKPGITDAYNVAKTSGYILPKYAKTVYSSKGVPRQVLTDMPLGLETHLQRPDIAPFWEKAKTLTERLEQNPNNIQGDLARLDMTVRLLREKADRLEAKKPTESASYHVLADNMEADINKLKQAPALETAQGKHKAMIAERDMVKEEMDRREGRFKETNAAFQGNSTTISQSQGIKSFLERANLMGDLVRGNWASFTAKAAGLFMGRGLTKQQAQSMALQLVEEAKILKGKEFPTQPWQSNVAKGGQLLGDATAYGTLLGGKANALLQGGGGGY